ncbi:MAG: NAD-dependent epimerase/dehydratase family protein [Mailhella sp.]|nr:NAD-dependent epimerase/dehydratase family protein [Mailhella sp.]
MTILITGANGFIGKHLVSELRGTAELLTPRSFELDLLDREHVDAFFACHNIDFIVHSAASGVRITPDAAERIAADNLLMVENLAAHVSADCPMLVLGSGAEYDKSRPLCKIKEEEWLHAAPTDPYGRGKHAISRFILDHEHICNLRIFGIYGMHEHPSRLPAYVLSRCMANEDILLNQNVVFDFLYVKDLCRIIRRFIEGGIQEKFVNACPVESISIRELAELAVSFFPDFTGQICFRNEGMGKEYTGSNNLLHTLLPEFSFTSYREGLTDYLHELKASSLFAPYPSHR